VKILGIDFGTVRMGLAVSDETLTLARELAILSPKAFWRRIEGLVSEHGIARVIVGLPLNMSGEATDKSREVQEFARRLQERLTVPVELTDERLSSVMAENIKGSRKSIDSLAAQIILQNYLDKTNV
jgi:putative Holliday junction resolvase